MHPQPLIKQLASLSTLEKAWSGLNKSNRKSFGLSGETIDTFSQSLETHLRSISNEIGKGRYSFSSFRGVAIKKTAGSYRPIKIPEIRDRIVLKAIANLISKPLEEKYQLDNDVSFAYRKKFGVEDAIRRMVKLYKAGNKFVLEADIKKFFDSVDRVDLLENKILPVLSDHTIDEIIKQGLAQEIGNRNDLTELEWEGFEPTFDGIPQGNALSPILSNVCLAEFDQRMIRERLGLVRYADDFIVMCKTEKDAHRAYLLALEEIEQKLRLKLYHLDEDKSKTKIVTPGSEPFSFLSIRFDGNEIWPEEKKLIELKEKIRFATNTAEFRDVLTVLRKTNNLICGWLASFSFSDVDRYFDEVDDYVNKELANALRFLGWKLKTEFTATTKFEYQGGHPTCLSTQQRKTSGVLTCRDFFKIKMKGRKKITEEILLRKEKSVEQISIAPKQSETILPF